MKAAVYYENGPPGVLRYEDLPDPTPAPDEVLLKVGAVSVNRSLDVRVRAGQYAVKPPLPHVLGCDPAGTVAASVANIGRTRFTGRRSRLAPRSHPRRARCPRGAVATRRSVASRS